MDSEKAIETEIEPQLVEDFGQEVANLLLTRATLCYATMIAGERQRFEAFVHSICTDGRVIEVWGQETAAVQGKRWRALIGLESVLEDAATVGRERAT